MKFLNCLVLLILISGCSSGDLRQQEIDSTSFRTSGVEQYFLPELPNWANFSAPGACYKRSSIHYLDFSKLKEVYQLSYTQMIELQAQYNERLENYFRSTAVRFLKPVEEASFFNNTMEQVRAGVKLIKIPGVKEVEVIWLESFTLNEQVEELKKMAKMGRFDQKLPLLFSSCHSRQSLTQWLSENELDNVGFHLLTAEWLSPYASAGPLHPGLKIEISELLGKEIKYSVLKSEIQDKQPIEITMP